jgi:mannosyltransferase
MSADPTALDERPARLRFATIVAVAAVVRLIFLGARSFWGDEIVSVKLAADNWRAFDYWILRREANMALYYLLLRGWVRFGDGEAWVRSFSAVCGILTVAAIYVLAKRIHGERVAWIAALLAATNACLVQFSQEARSYSMLMLLVVLSYYFFLRAIEEKSLWTAAAYVLISACALYTHFFAALTVCAQVASLLWFPTRQVPWRRLVTIYFALAATAVPVAIYILKNDVGQLYWVQPTTVSEIYKLFIFFAGASKAVAAVLSVMSLLMCVLALVHGAAKLRSRSAESWRIGLVLSWALAPPLIAALISIPKPVFVHRYLLVSLPGYLILIAVGLSQLQRKALVTLLTIFVALSGVSIGRGYFRPVEDWRNAVAYVLDNAQESDALLPYIPYGSNNFNFYARRIERTKQHPRLNFVDSAKGVSQIAGIASPRTWLVLYPSPHVAELAPEFEQALASRYSKEERREFKGVTIVLFSGLKQPSSLLPTESESRR